MKPTTLIISSVCLPIYVNVIPIYESLKNLLELSMKTTDTKSTQTMRTNLGYKTQYKFRL